jgi:hypothetical protein
MSSKPGVRSSKSEASWTALPEGSNDGAWARNLAPHRASRAAATQIFQPVSCRS